MKWNQLTGLPTIALLLALSGHGAHAACVRTKYADTGPSLQAPINMGNVHLSHLHLQPLGSLLASTVVPPTNFSATGANANTPLWTCDFADRNSLLFLVAVNGIDRVGGNHRASKGVSPDQLVYATYFKHVGARLSMNGVTLSRTWTAVKVPSYENVDNKKIHIRLGDVPPLLAEFYKIGDFPDRGASPFEECSALGSFGLAEATAGIANYDCGVPSAYIQLSGGGITSDAMGNDSATHRAGIGGLNGFAYGFKNAATLTLHNTCMVKNFSTSVNFPPISVQELTTGDTRQENFSVQIECGPNVASGVATGEMAIGIQASAGALAAAANLGLITGTGTTPYLVSDDYLTDTNVAKGVGISLKHAQTQRNMLFLGQNLNSGAGTSGDSAWYPVLEGATPNVASATHGLQRHTHVFTATLSRLPGHNVSSGKVRATAYVHVRVQ